MSKRKWINKRKKILRETLQGIFDFHDENTKLVPGGLTGKYDERNEQYRDRVRESHSRKQSPLTKEEVAPFKAAFKIDEVYDKLPAGDQWKVRLAAIFSQFYEKVEIVNGYQLREHMTSKDLDRCLLDDPKYDEYWERAKKLCRDGVEEVDPLEVMERLRLEDFRSQVVPDGESFYVTYSPKIRNGLGEDVFPEVERLYMKVSEADIAEFDAMMKTLRLSIQNGEDIDLNILGSKDGRHLMPLNRQKNIQYLCPMSVFKSTKEYFFPKKDWSRDGDFSSSFERKVSWYLSGRTVVFDAFSGTWENINDFIISIFCTYFEYARSLNRISICAQCVKMYVPENYAKSRCKFCSDKCRKASFRDNDIVKCYNRQRAWFKSRAEILEDYLRLLKVKENGIPSFQSIEQKTVCSGGKCPHKFFPSSGYCKVFLEKNCYVMDIYKIYQDELVDPE